MIDADAAERTAKRPWWRRLLVPAPPPPPPPPVPAQPDEGFFSKPYFETPIYEVVLQRYPWLVTLMLIQASTFRPSAQHCAMSSHATRIRSHAEHFGVDCRAV